MLQKRPAPLRQQVNAKDHDTSINEEPPKTKSAAGVEAKKRRRDDKLAQKKKKDNQLAKNRLNAPNNFQELLADLNVLADDEFQKAPEVDEEGKPVPNYFYTRHDERDLDFLGDLDAIQLKDIKRAMNFDLTCLRYASRIPFAYTRD
jgi:hypothetical protein